MGQPPIGIMQGVGISAAAGAAGAPSHEDASATLPQAPFGKTVTLPIAERKQSMTPSSHEASAKVVAAEGEHAGKPGTAEKRAQAHQDAASVAAVPGHLRGQSFGAAPGEPMEQSNNQTSGEQPAENAEDGRPAETQPASSLERSENIRVTDQSQARDAAGKSVGTPGLDGATPNAQYSQKEATTPGSIAQ